MTEPFRAITLHQPWASLIACGAKPFETRTWAPPRSLIGQRIAIHAAARPIRTIELGHLLNDIERWAGRLPLEVTAKALNLLMPEWRRETLPTLGAVVCTAVLSAAYQCGETDEAGQVEVVRAISRGDDPVLVQSDPFGDFSPGRWVWLLTDVQPLAQPVAATGRQGWWTWTPPDLNTPPLRHVPAPSGSPAIA